VMAHKFLAFKKDKEDTVAVTSWRGGPDFLWKQLVKSKGGGSIRTMYRHSRRARESVSQTVQYCPTRIRQAVGKRVASSVEGAPIFLFKYGCHLIIESEEDQMLLQHANRFDERPPIHRFQSDPC
jgi:hypothetical protein